MFFSKEKLLEFTELLDRTAEKNPLLWLPCVLSLAVILGVKRLCGSVKALAARLGTVSEKPLFMRFTACIAAAAFALCMTPKALETASAADNTQVKEADSAEENTGDNADSTEQTENAEKETDVSETKPETAETDTKAATDKQTVKSGKKDISITLECDVENISKGTAHISTRKEFLNGSAVLKIMSSDTADEAAGSVMSKLGDMSGYYEFYPFDMNLSDAESGDDVALINDGFITVEMPIPKRMLRNPELIKVYHINDGHPETIESELVVSDSEKTVVRFNAKEFSPYIFVTPSYYEEDVSAAAGAYDGSAPVETAAIPSAGGVSLPNVCGDIPKNLKFSSKKRRYRVLRKRKLDEMVFVY